MEVYSTIAIVALLFGLFQRAALFEYFPNLGVLFEVFLYATFRSDSST